MLRTLLAAGLTAVSFAALAAPPGYTDNPGRQEAQSHTGNCGYGDSTGVTGAGAGGFGALQGKGNNHAGGRQGEANYNPDLCGNPNENALTRGGQN